MKIIKDAIQWVASFCLKSLLKIRYLFIRMINNIGCLLVQSYTLPSCLLKPGGISKVYLLPAVNSFENYSFDADDKITGYTTSTSWYEFEQIFETSSGFETQVIDEKTGSIYWQIDLEFQIPKLSAANRKILLQLINTNQLLAIYTDNNGRSFLLGKDHYLRVTESTLSTGKAFDEFNGTLIKISGKEKFPSYQINYNSESNACTTITQALFNSQTIDQMATVRLLCTLGYHF